MKTKLTKKQALIMEFIEVFTSEHNQSPSYREIMTALGLSSVSAVAEHIDNLVGKGVLRKSPGAARSLEIITLPYPETRALFEARLASATPAETETLLAAATILGLEL